MNFDDGDSYTHFYQAKSSKKGSYSKKSWRQKKNWTKRVKSFFALGRGQKHKTWCFSQAKHRTDLKNISKAMNFDDGDSYTHFYFSKFSKKGISSKINLDVKIFVLTKSVKSFFALGRGAKHKSWCISPVKHRTDLKNISKAMNLDDGAAYTHFC